jgi:hypothetical protein
LVHVRKATCAQYSIDASGCPDHHGKVDARLHHDVAKFVALIRPLLESDPVRHTVALTLSHVLMRAPDPTGDPPVLLTIHREECLAGAAICTPPRGLIVSALPAESTGAAAEALAPGYPGLPGAFGPRDVAEVFAQTWSASTGVSVHELMAQRLYGLHRLTPPVGVPGTVRQAGVGDFKLLAQWRQDFADEATGGLRGPGSAADPASTRSGHRGAVMGGRRASRGVGIGDCPIGRNVADSTGVHAAAASRGTGTAAR